MDFYFKSKEHKVTFDHNMLIIHYNIIHGHSKSKMHKIILRSS